MDHRQQAAAGARGTRGVASGGHRDRDRGRPAASPAATTSPSRAARLTPAGCSRAMMLLTSSAPQRAGLTALWARHARLCSKGRARKTDGNTDDDPVPRPEPVLKLSEESCGFDRVYEGARAANKRFCPSSQSPEPSPVQGTV